MSLSSHAPFKVLGCWLRRIVGSCESNKRRMKEKNQEQKSAAWNDGTRRSERKETHGRRDDCCRVECVEEIFTPKSPSRQQQNIITMPRSESKE